MATSMNKTATVIMVGAAMAFAILAATAPADQSVLLNKPATPSDDSNTGPILPPPQNPITQSASGQSRTVELPPPSESSPNSEVLPSPPQRAPLPPQTNQPTSRATKQSFMRPAEPRSPGKGKLVGEEPMPMPSDASPSTPPILPPPGEDAVPPASALTPGIQVKPTPRIDYDTHHDARRMLRSGEIQIVVLTKDPAEGCYYQIPLTVPACCAGEPNVAAGLGLLGRGVVAYEWPCGFKAKIKFRRLIGDIKVDYEAD